MKRHWLARTLAPAADAPWHRLLLPADVGIIAFTLLVAGLGIVLATVLGFAIGIARLSPNWLLARLAGGYVELIRNLPLLFQILFWYLAVLGSLPFQEIDSMPSTSVRATRTMAVRESVM